MIQSTGKKHKERSEEQKGKKTYNTRDSLVVTDPTTSLALTGLSMGERTGSRVFQWVWSYVLLACKCGAYQARQLEFLWAFCPWYVLSFHLSTGTLQHRTIQDV
ncbi:hypothetical protein NEUTE2DRAFT_61119 [Neurospora tetrasperma FGSC 2509]|nr:hypothetical protein NEUTE2DRAFT_61119 [Neurospora tetrasperma FGSC 2509]